jgi:hypothetical protein
MKSKKLALLLGSALLVLLGACTTRLGSFTVVSTRNIEWNRAAEYTRGGERVEGADTVHFILFISTKASIDMQTAVDDALDQIPGSVAIVDAVLALRSWSVLVYGQTSYIVTGSALVDPVLAGNIVESEQPAATGTDTYLVFSYNDDGVMEKRAVTAEEYAEYVNSI